MTSTNNNHHNNHHQPSPLGSRRPLEETPPSFMRHFATEESDACWTCPTCGPITPRPLRWGTLVRYARGQCACQVQAEQRRREQEARVSWNTAQIASTYGWYDPTLVKGTTPVLSTRTFATFQQEWQPEAYTLARAWSQNPCGTLILYGDYGTGKTHLLAAIANATREERRMSSLFVTVTDLFVAIQERIAAHEDHTALILRAARTPLLLLDDIDKARRTDFREETYFAIVDKRVQQRLPLALSTNRVEELASFVGGAVASRLKVGQIAVPMYGTDFRATLSSWSDTP